MAAVWSAACLWMMTVCFLSFQRGEDTSALGMGMTEILIRWLPFLGEKFGVEELHALLRKIAHVGAFFVLGVTVELSAEMSARVLDMGHRKLSRIAFLLCTIVAVMTEVLKVGIPGRHLDWGEALLNFASVCLGIGSILLMSRYRKRGK